MADIGVINANGEKIFTYLNFEKIPDYVEVVESIEARFAVGCGGQNARQCRTFSFVRRSHESGNPRRWSLLLGISSSGQKTKAHGFPLSRE